MKTTSSPVRRISRIALACALATALLSASPAAAQDPPPDPAPAVPAADALDGKLDRLRRLHGVAVDRPVPPRQADLPEDREEAAKLTMAYRKARKEWEDSLDALISVSDEYVELASGGGAPEVRYFGGYGRARKSEIVSRDDAAVLLARAESDFRAFLDAAAPNSVHRGDAGHQLTRVLLRGAGADPERVAAAAAFGDRAVRDLVGAGSAYDAGALAYVVLKALIDSEQEETAARIAGGWDVNTTDWDVSTRNVRMLARRTRLRPGAPFPDMPDVLDANGNPLDFAALRGRPFLLHFFSTVVSTASEEVETIVQPLHATWQPFGLQVVGVSLDFALDDARLAETKANWEEWGKKEPVPDGRLPSVRAWCDVRDVDWPWYWDGKWTENVLVRHLGVDVNRPYIVLVDDSGIVRFRGAPGKGTAGEVYDLQEAFAKTPRGAALVAEAKVSGLEFPERPMPIPLVVPVVAESPAGTDAPTTDGDDDEPWDEDVDDDGDAGDSGRRGVLGLLLAVAAALAVGLVLIFRRR